LNLLIDISALLGVILGGFARSAQCIALGSIAFIFILSLPLQANLGAAGAAILAKARRIGMYAALTLGLLLSITLVMHAAILSGTLDIGFAEALSDDFARATLVRIAVAVLLATLIERGSRPSYFLLPLGLIDLAAGVATSHAAASINDRALLAAITATHHLGAAIWIGGLPCFLWSLAHADDRQRRLIGKRYSLMSIGAVACIAFSGIGLLVHFVGSPEAMYGTAYGMMLGAKLALFASLLLLGAMNFLAVDRLSKSPAHLTARLRRFVEVELGIGISVIFVAASMTSLPPAIDLVDGRATLSEIAERLEPHWPKLTSPAKDTLAFYELQQKLDATAAQKKTTAQEAYVPGAGVALRADVGVGVAVRRAAADIRPDPVPGQDVADDRIAGRVPDVDAAAAVARP